MLLVALAVGFLFFHVNVGIVARSMAEEAKWDVPVQYTVITVWANLASMIVLLIRTPTSGEFTDTILMGVVKVLIAAAWVECYGYAVHRVFHSRWFYPIHKWHHAWINPNPWSALYSHPIENVLFNYGMIGPPVYFTSMAYVTTFLWLMLVMNNTLMAHSGRLNDSRGVYYSRHNTHHKNPSVMFGNGMGADELFGTDCPQEPGTH